MAAASSEERLQVLKAFDNSMGGVKSLADSGLNKIPKVFIRPSEELAEEAKLEKSEAQIPVIDLSNIDDVVARKQIVEGVKAASQTMGFFQVVNHGVPLSVLDGMIDGVRRFHELDVEEKRKYYSREQFKTVKYSSTADLFNTSTASWRDTLTISLFNGYNSLNPQELPAVCRDSVAEYSKHLEKLGNIIFGLLSEALGLETGRLENMECSKGHRFVGHYYPACPEPDLAIGTLKHSDAGFLTILLQSQQICSLQCMYENKWIDIHPTPGGLVINIGDLLQLVSNGKFKSVQHRVIANREGPRISVACFFAGPLRDTSKVYGPIKEMITDECPAIYKDVNLSEYMKTYVAVNLNTYPGADYYRI